MIKMKLKLFAFNVVDILWLEIDPVLGKSHLQR